MNRDVLQRPLSRACRALLLLYPARFRAEYADDVAEVFEDLCAHTPGSFMALLVAGSAALLRVGLGGLSERFSRRPPLATSLPAPRPPRDPGDRMVSTLFRDVAYGIRSLVAKPGFALMAIAMLAFGIAANTTVFTLFSAAFVRPLPFPDPHRLVDLDEVAPKWGIEYVGISYPDFHAWNELNTAFESMAVFDRAAYNFATDTGTDRVDVALVSWQFGHVLGIEPQLGRGFTAADDAEGAEKVALLGDSIWRERFGADPAVLGTAVRLDSEPHTVIGVLPAEAIFPAGTDMWVPLSTIDFCCDPDEGDGSWWLSGIGRLNEGISLDQARADLEAAHATLVDRLGSSREISTPRLEPLVERYLGNSRPQMLVLLSAVGILLLVTCTNIGGLLLARSTTRAREVAIRMALGAGRARIVGQMLTEAAVLAAVSSVVGVLGARLMLVQIGALIPDQALGWIELGLDVRVIAFAVAIGAASVLAFALMPALSTSSMGPGAAMHETSTRSSASRGRRRALSTLVAAEVALAVVLLVGAGLTIQAFRALTNVEPGFRRDVLTFHVSLPQVTYPSADERVPFFFALHDRLAALDSIEGVGMVSNAPLGGHSGFFFQAHDSILGEDDTPVVLTRNATSGYLKAMGLTLLAGRGLEDADRAPESDLVILVNETFARTFWGTLEVIGKQVDLGRDTTYTVVGLTHDTKHYGLDEPMRPGVFLPFGRRDFGRDSMTFALRGGEDPRRFATAVREVVRELDPEVPIFGVATMEEALQDSTWSQRLSSLLIGTFAGSALVLALAGIYSTISYGVGERRREIGVRIALGALERQVLGQVLGDGLRLTAIGLVAGLVLALAASGAISSLLFGVSPRDPITYAAVVSLLLLTAIGATLLPARRAARTDPAEALRAD